MDTILLPILTVPSEFLYREHVLHRSLLKYVFDKCILGIDSLCNSVLPELKGSNVLEFGVISVASQVYYLQALCPSELYENTYLL